MVLVSALLFLYHCRSREGEGKRSICQGVTSARRGSRLCGPRNLLPGSALARVQVQGRRYSAVSTPLPRLPVPPFQTDSRRTRELFFRHRAYDRPGTKTCKTTLLEADRVLRGPRSQSDGLMAQAGLYYTALPTSRGCHAWLAAR
jgi:hypothetical protein